MHRNADCPQHPGVDTLITGGRIPLSADWIKQFVSNARACGLSADEIEDDLMASGKGFVEDVIVSVKCRCPGKGCERMSVVIDGLEYDGCGPAGCANH